jgi:hypothetical protein
MRYAVVVAISATMRRNFFDFRYRVVNRNTNAAVLQHFYVVVIISKRDNFSGLYAPLFGEAT